MKREPHITLRPVEAEDAALLRAVFADARGCEFVAAGLEAGVTELLLDLQQRAQDAGYRRDYPQAEHCVIEADGVPCGRLVIDRRWDELRVVDLALLADARGRGIGSGLLRSLQQGAARGACRVRLRVAHGNPARRLYERLGFREVASDEVYADMRWEPGAERHCEGHSRDGQQINRGVAA